MSDIFFIIGCPRSGTTAMTEMLNTASNAVVYTELPPKFCIAARLQYEGQLAYPKEFIHKSKAESTKSALNSGKKFGDKNPNYLYFIQELAEIWDCKFLFLNRDGRDVVRSSMDFHNARSAGYARYEDDESSLTTQPEDDFWDFVRIRPLPSTPDFSRWREYDRFEKFAWGWAEYSRIMLEKAGQLNSSEYLQIDMTSVDTNRMKQVFDFLQLDGFESRRISKMLDAKINTTNVKSAERFPDWRRWDEETLAKFNKHAQKMMETLGYY